MPGSLIDFDTLTNAGFPLLNVDGEEKIFQTGQTGNCLYLVKTGSVRIVSFGTILELIKPNGMFGEMSLIDGAPRSATAIAAEPSVLAKVDRAAFRLLVQHNPDFALSVMELMARRLRQMNQDV